MLHYESRIQMSVHARASADMQRKCVVRAVLGVNAASGHVGTIFVCFVGDELEKKKRILSGASCVQPVMKAHTDVPT